MGVLAQGQHPTAMVLEEIKSLSNGSKTVLLVACISFAWLVLRLAFNILQVAVSLITRLVPKSKAAKKSDDYEVRCAEAAAG